MGLNNRHHFTNPGVNAWATEKGESNGKAHNNAFGLNRRSKTSGQLLNPDRTRPLDLISELVGQSFRKNHRWIILGHVLFDHKRARSRECLPKIQNQK